LHLETSLDPRRFHSLLAKLPHPYLKANYDAGNSASLGYDVLEEIAAYGERIGSVHIKDRIRGGGTVPLGSGDANIPALLSELFRIGYKGDFVMQIARGEAGKELGWIRQNRELVLGQLQAAGFVAGAGR
jgi:hexulose-6-phosphate isomerase